MAIANRSLALLLIAITFALSTSACSSYSPNARPRPENPPIPDELMQPPPAKSFSESAAERLKSWRERLQPSRTGCAGCKAPLRRATAADRALGSIDGV